MSSKSQTTERIAVGLIAVLIAGVVAPASAWACDSCWGASVDTPTTRGITMAMTALIGMTGLVWGGIGAFFLHVRRRSRMLEPGGFVVTEHGDIRESDGAEDETF